MQTVRQADRQAGRQQGRLTDRQTGRQTCSQVGALAGILAGWHTNRQTNRQAPACLFFCLPGRQTDRQKVKSALLKQCPHKKRVPIKLGLVHGND